MPRPTRLRVLEERLPPEIEDDNRNVVEAFAKPAEVTADSPLGQDILELLAKSHDRVASEAKQATAIASEAINRADTALQKLGETEAVIAAKADAVQKGVTEVAERAIGELEHAAAKQVRAGQATAAAIAVSAGMLRSLGERLAGLATFAVDRAPALLALAAGVWLWHDTLADPKPLQLVSLALFGFVVIAPAIWLSSRRG